MTSEIRAVSFDCWSTLIYEPDWALAHGRRVDALRRAAARLGVALDVDGARHAFDQAWKRHLALWMESRASGADEIAGWALESCTEVARARAEPEVRETLAQEIAEASLQGEVAALAGARETLEWLASRGVRRALVCDTGLSPGRVVRQQLERVGLLRHLEVLIFSDEAGVTKPDPRVFREALAGLGTEPEHSAHVGDLRRTDVAGARTIGMRSVRIRDHHDDRSPLPDADWVADTHAHLRELLAANGS